MVILTAIPHHEVVTEFSLGRNPWGCGKKIIPTLQWWWKIEIGQIHGATTKF
ncbi:MAG: hypothetical protein WCJ56_05630 [bacterium]